MNSSEDQPAMNIVDASPRVQYSSDPWHLLVQHIGYLALGSASMCGNALAVIMFLQEVKTRHEIGQRPLLLAGIVADFMNGLGFAAAGGSGVAMGDWRPCVNDCAMGEAISGLNSCVETFYTSAEIFLQVFMALLALITSIDRLAAIAAPVFYAQNVKPRHCNLLMPFLVTGSLAVLVLAASRGENAPGSKIAGGQSWPSYCIAPYPDGAFSYFYYMAVCPVIMVAIILNLIGLASYSRLAAQRAVYEAEFNVTVRNYLPRHAFGPTSTPSPPASRPSSNEQRRRSNQLFHPASSVNRFVPHALLATATNTALCLLLPCVFFWFGVDSGWGRKRNTVQILIAGYLANGIAAYSLFNSLIFYMIHKSSRINFRLVMTSVINRLNRCVRRKSNGVCETTPVEVIRDPVTSQSSPISLTSIANHNRMKTHRPSIVPLAYGTAEI